MMNNRPYHHIFSLLLLFAFMAGCTGPSPAAFPEPTPAPTPAYWPAAGWKSTPPEQQGMDSSRLADMLEHIQTRQIRMHSILVIRNGYTVLEAYFNPYTAETPHQIASITKSVMGALVGIAFQQGKIKSIDEPVVNFFRDRKIANLDARKRAMTLKHLLMLAPGLDCSDIQGTEAQMMQSQDWVQFVLDLPMKYDPGTNWTYCSSAVHLVSAILQKSTGMDARTYANQFLFASIGIKQVPPERWYSDPQGISGGGNGLMLTPPEIARFAYLYLNQGRWADQQIIPARWIAESLAQQITVGKMKEYGDMERSYGYLWSLYPEKNLISALGRNGQHIHFMPEENLVVVFTSATPVVSDERQFDLLKNYILPAIQSDQALPENPQDAARLAEDVERAAWPRIPVSELPSDLQQLDGRVIHFAENPYGWQTLRFDFAPESNRATAVINEGVEIRMNLDNLFQVQEVSGMGKVGFKAAWDDQGRLLVYQSYIGTWTELEISVRVEGEKVTLFQHNLVDGGSLMRMEGRLE